MVRDRGELRRDGSAVWIRLDQLEDLPQELQVARWTRYQYFASMLIDDLKFSILRDPRVVEREEEILEVEPSDRENQRLLSEGLSWRQPSYNPTRSLDAFLGQCARTLLLHQRADYEVVYLRDPETDTAERFQLFPLTPCFYRDEGRDLVQTVPPRIAREFSVPAEIRLSEDRVLRIQMPREEWEEKYNAILLLAGMGSASMPDFVMESFRDPSKRVPFDMDEWKDKRDLAALKASAPFGWDVRGLPEAPVTIYYRAYRALTWIGVLAELRDSILRQLDVGLAMVRDELPGVPSVHVVEEFSSESMTKLAEALQDGALPPQVVLEHASSRGAPLTQWLPED